MHWESRWWKGGSRKIESDRSETKIRCGDGGETSQTTFVGWKFQNIEPSFSFQWVWCSYIVRSVYQFTVQVSCPTFHACTENVLHFPVEVVYKCNVKTGMYTCWHSTEFFLAVPVFCHCCWLDILCKFVRFWTGFQTYPALRFSESCETSYFLDSSECKIFVDNF